MSKHTNIHLRCITPTDIPILLTWRNSDTFRDLCTRKTAILTEDEFSAETKTAFTFDRCEQMLILVDDVPVGTVYAYKYSSAGNHVFVTTFLDQRYRGRAMGVYALADYCASIFARFNLYKVYFEVRSYNNSVIRLLTRLNLPIEARLDGHGVYRESRYDLLIFAVYEKDLRRILGRLHRE